MTIDRLILRFAAVFLVIGAVAFLFLWAVYPDVAAGALDGALGCVCGAARP